MLVIVIAKLLFLFIIQIILPEEKVNQGGCKYYFCENMKISKKMISFAVK